jgi:hypothetical protein
MDEKENVISEEEKLKKDLRFYSNLIELTPTCIKVFDANRKLTFINKGGRFEHYIKDTDDISVWDWFATMTKEGQSAISEAFEKGIQGRSSRIVTENRPQGSIYQWSDSFFWPINDGEGKVTEILVYSFDATERKHAEIELEKKTKDLETRNADLAKMNELMVGRELKMAELKKRIEELEVGSGK